MEAKQSDQQNIYGETNNNLRSKYFLINKFKLFEFYIEYIEYSVGQKVRGNQIVFYLRV